MHCLWILLTLSISCISHVYGSAAAALAMSAPTPAKGAVKVCHYEILEVERNADVDIIKKAYRKSGRKDTQASRRSRRSWMPLGQRAIAECALCLTVLPRVQSSLALAS